MDKIIQTRLNEIEQQLLIDVCVKMGYRPSEAMRQGLRLLYTKTFPNYVLNKKEKEPEPEPPTAEAWCLEQGGILVIDEETGKRYCHIIEGAMERDIPVPEDLI